MRLKDLKNIFFVVLSGVFLTGCAWVSVETSNGNKLGYFRVGNQQIGNFSIDPNGVASLESQKSENESLYLFLNKIADKIP